MKLPVGYGAHVFGQMVVHVTPHGSATHLPGEPLLYAVPQASASYRATARALGYGDNTHAMCREHDYLHALLCHALGIGCSPALLGAVRHQAVTPLTGAEEDLVLAAQRFINLHRGADVPPKPDHDRDLRELQLWREEARIAQLAGAHPHARSIAARMQARVEMRLIGGERVP